MAGTPAIQSVRLYPAIQCVHRLFHSYLNETKQNQLSILIIYFHIYEFQIKLTLSVVIYAILAFFNHPVAPSYLEQIQKNETASCVTGQLLCQ